MIASRVKKKKRGEGKRKIQGKREWERSR